jgi:3-oxoacyl-[acyl-carrier-protein] synthase-3
MNIQPAVPGARILSLGDYQPANVVTNADLAARMETSDEWIRSRVGIASRRVAGPDETVPDMAVAAGGKALAASGLEPADVDLVVVATCTMPTPIPTAAPQVAARLGITAPGAYDLNGACAGFAYGLSAAASAITSGAARNVLVIGSEKLTDWVDQDDRSTAIIFADGAGAAVVGPARSPEEVGIGPVAWGSAGDRAELITIPSRTGFLGQDGQPVFRWATTAMVPVALEACRRAGVAPGELAAFIPHQANLRIVETIARKLGAPQARVADDIVEAGNTSSASIPLALARMAARGEVRSGDPVLLLGFGAGLTYAGQVVLCP